MIETEIYKVAASRYGRRVVMRLASRWWWALALPLGAAIIVGIWDWRWWFVALVMIFILYPGLLFIAYYYYALSPEAVRAILPQRAQITPDAVTLIYYPIAEGCNAPKPRVIPKKDIRSVSLEGNYIDLQLDKEEVIEIPKSAFPPGTIREAFPNLNEINGEMN